MCTYEYRTRLKPGKYFAMGGYMTVEAAFVVPWVIFIIVWLIYLGYFEYDRCLLFQDNYTLATQTASKITTVDGQQEWLNTQIGFRYGNKYMGSRSLDAKGEVSGSKVKISSSLKVSHPLSYDAGMIPDSNWNISDTVEADNFSFTKRIRLFRAAGRVLDGG
ncbi:MAG: hypothetical protein K6G12_07500 [Lachnospiraceae bacterium]|nr:hypothetical protein [Lachnospiraceae bacterium]